MGLYRRFKQKVKQLLGRQEQNAVILMYHRVVDVETSPYHGIVSTDHFLQQMEFLHKISNPLSLIELKDAIKQKEIPTNSVIITFDDGYADNYTNAIPILTNFQIPATIFITSEYVGSKREYWWDELERIFILPEKLPEKAPFMVGNQMLDLNFARFNKDQRIHLLRGMHGLLRSCRPGDRQAILDGLLAMSGLPENGREDYRPMTEKEIITLSRNGLVDIGAHTMTHPVLSALSREEQQAEIIGSIRAVTEIIGKPVHSFAYPFGSPQEINNDSLEIIRSTEIQTAVTTTPEKVNPESNLLALPRVWVGDWDQKTFQQRMEPYFQEVG